MPKPTPKSATLTVKRLPLDKLKPHPRNPRQHPEPGSAEWQTLRRSLESEYFDPLVWNKRNGLLVSGHLRTKILAESGYESADCVIVDWDEPTHLARMIAANKLQGENDDKLLSELFRELMAAETDLDLTGFTQEEMIDFGFLESNTEPDDEHAAELIDKAAELQKVWKTTLGQVWELGEHRLMCGDSTKRDEVSKLMAGDLCSLCVTDPPYGVSYGSKNQFLNSIDKGNRVQSEIANDHETKEATQAMWKAAFGEMANTMLPGAVVYSFMPQGGDQMMMMMMMVMGAGIEPRHELIWLKNNHVLGRVDYAYKHEPIMYAWKKGGHKFYGGFQTSIIECAKPTKSDLHPTTKPVEVVSRLIENSSRPGEIVYEPFSGSGTTLIACDQLKRKCRAMELETKYAAVCLQRWADLTGKTPKLIK
jgi:DNA modification methylase